MLDWYIFNPVAQRFKRYSSLGDLTMISLYLNRFLTSFSLSMLVCAEISGLQADPTFVQFGPQDEKLSHILWFSGDCLAYISAAFLFGLSPPTSSCAENSGLQADPTFVPFGHQDQRVSHFWWFLGDCLAYISTAFLIGFAPSISSCAEKSGLHADPTFVQFGPQGQEILHFLWFHALVYYF
jgi:hypothetical protein